MGFKDLWKTKPYWLKGTFIGALFGFFYGLIGTITSSLNSCNWWIDPSSPIYCKIFPSNLITPYLFKFFTTVTMSDQLRSLTYKINMVLIWLIACALLGLIIGTIVGKIKSKQ